MKPIKINIDKIKNNPQNPRVIKDYKFNKLVKSIKDFPEMMQLRPIVVDENNIILGGNMRYKAAVQAGLKNVYVIQADDLSEKQKKEFVIKDNSSFGEWDWDVLANEWELNELKEWGLDLPRIYFDEDEEPEVDKDIFHQELDTYINAKVKQITLYFNADEYEKAVKDLETIREKESLTDNTQAFKFLIDKYGL
jgi:ParB-like chromosome segregation protein Spo0J